MPLNEADTRAKLIDPAIYRCGWTEDHISREVTAGGIDLVGDNKAARRKNGKVDYLLRVKVTGGMQPVALAVLEAKKESLMPGHGLEQAKGYAKCERLNVQFVISSNGHQFVLFDRHTGLTTDARPMAEFPSPDTLRARYEQAQGFSLDDEAAKPLLQPYAGGEGQRRYYQDAAIRAVFEKLARCERKKEPKRALLSLATGAGKTFIAVNTLKRLSDAGQMTRALFLCDRDELRTQALAAFSNVFGADAAEAFRKPDGTNNAKNARVHIATYQTLGVAEEDGDASFLTTFYPEDHFSHIIIDECHRSAWGKWSQVLKRNSQAAQIGLTATPRKLSVEVHTKEAQQDAEITANNLKYFGEPVYQYTYTQAVEDGYLAACEIKKGRVNIDDQGLTLEQIMALEPRDARTGELLTTADVKAHYESTSFEDKLLLPDRVDAMCRDLFKYLLESGGPEQKTIIFCARDSHADAVAAKLNNLYAKWCTDHGRERLDMYAFKCTASSSGNDQLPDLRASTRSHFIATTVDLLTTGVDVPVIRNIVFFKYLKSPISFYQMVGRGTRLHPESQKLMFRLYDYTNATRLFGEEFITGPARERGEGGGGGEEPPRIITVQGIDVHVTPAGHLIVAEVDGVARSIPVEEYRQRLAARLLEQAHTLEEFRAQWVDPPEREELMQLLLSSGCSPSVVQLVDEMEAYDLYDVLAHLGWGALPRTREDRFGAFRFKHEQWLAALPAQAREALLALAKQFAADGTDGLENPRIFQTPAVLKAGGVAALQEAGEPAALLKETKNRMFAA